VQHRGAVRYWRFFRSERRWDFLVVGLWVAALALSYWVISLHPRLGIQALTLAGGMTLVVLGYFLRFRRGRPRE